MSDRDFVTPDEGLRTTPPGSLLDALEVERLLRYEWWLNHGHDYPALYGDDGEMQCQACPMDFKRAPLGELRDHVFRQRIVLRTGV